MDVDSKYCPTSIVVLDRHKHAHLRVLKEEIFGGILPVLMVSDADDAIQYIRSQRGTPLSLYVFTRDTSTFEKVGGMLKWVRGFVLGRVSGMYTPRV